MVKNCLVCGKLYKRNNKFSKKQWAESKYCSRTCSAKTQRQRINQVCLTCKVIFEDVPSRILENKGKFCSKKCHISSQRGHSFSVATQFVKNDVRISGKNAYQWKGDGAGYSAKHDWMRLHYGKPNFCEGCGTEKDRQYYWANISGRYLRDREDWLRLCSPCHNKFDNISVKLWNTRRKNIN